MIGDWGKLHNQELHDLHLLPNIIRVFKSRSMRWAEYVTRKGDNRGAYSFSGGRSEGKNLKDIGVEWRKLLKADLQDLG